MPTPEEIAAMTPEQTAAYYKELYDAEVAAHGTTQASLTQAQSDLAASAQQVAAGADNAALSQAQADLAAEKEAHQATKVQAADEIGSLSEKLANATKAAAQGYVTVDHGGKTYKVIGKQFNIKGKVVTVEDLITDDASKAYLIEKGSSILVEIE